MASVMISLLPGAWGSLPKVCLEQWSLRSLQPQPPGGVGVVAEGEGSCPFCHLVELSQWTSWVAVSLPHLPCHSWSVPTPALLLLLLRLLSSYCRLQAPTTRGHTHINDNLKTAQGPKSPGSADPGTYEVSKVEPGYRSREGA